jgi:hypothetical protein
MISEQLEMQERGMQAQPEPFFPINFFLVPDHAFCTFAPYIGYGNRTRARPEIYRLASGLF